MAKCGVESHQFSGLVDSGASMYFISKSLEEMLGWEIIPYIYVLVQLSDGKLVNSTYET